MVHTWDTILVVIRVHDNESNEDRFLDPDTWVQSDRWVKHGDMARQYAFCIKVLLLSRLSSHIFYYLIKSTYSLIINIYQFYCCILSDFFVHIVSLNQFLLSYKLVGFFSSFIHLLIHTCSHLQNNILRQKEEALNNNSKHEDREKWIKLSSNLSVYMDVWCSLNGRFQQRIFDPNVDMLTVDWHPFKHVSFVMPLLTQYNSYRWYKNLIYTILIRSINNHCYNNLLRFVITLDIKWTIFKETYTVGRTTPTFSS